GDVAFVGAPLAAAGRLVVPVLDGATSELRALSLESGATIWRTVLCDEPRTGGPTWSRTALDRAGRHLFCAPGLGVVAAVDEASGAIRWVARYPRTARPDALATNLSGGPSGSSANPAGAGRDDTGLTWDGWRDDQLLAVGPLVLVAVSDSDELIALDRINGQPRWTAPRRLSGDGAALRIVGANERIVWLETGDGVRTLELATGRLVAAAASRPASDRLPSSIAVLHELATAARTVEAVKQSVASPPTQPAALAKPSLPLERNADEKNVGVLVSDGANGRVAEMDWAGNERWSVGGLGLPGACCQAENGSRWVVTHRPLALREISRDGRLVDRAVSLASRPASLEGLRDGRLLCSFPDQNLVAELDEGGRIGWSVKVTGRPVDARRLADGRTLVCLLEDRRVVEIDAVGRIVWDSGDVAQPRSALRTADGHTVITSLGSNLAVELAPAPPSGAGVSERPPSEAPSLAVTWTRSGLRQPLAALRGP
ncbi:MAG TPA: PQQ-binding-like beta-propeller repeat protein, partial [Pirellulaceae bacterium]|nr:PQQ-binding-like beta-propeller repeat protein [Pirellulaceae bacterium]